MRGYQTVDRDMTGNVTENEPSDLRLTKAEKLKVDIMLIGLLVFSLVSAALFIFGIDLTGWIAGGR